MLRIGAIKAALVVLVSAGLGFFAIDAFAQDAFPGNSTALDSYGINYFNNAHTAGAGGPKTGPDDTLRVVDPDEYSPNTLACVNIYVFDAIEEMQECCACPISSGGRLDFSVNGQLTSNPTNGQPFNFHSGVIKIVKTNINPLGVGC